MATTTNIYPPIIDVAMPAFVTPPYLEEGEGPAETNVSIKFSVSKYNAVSDLSSYCCVSLTDASTNYTCFNTISGMKFYQWGDDSVTVHSCDLVRIKPGHKEGWWDPDKRYKLQIRFIKANAVTANAKGQMGIKIDDATFYTFTELEAQPGILTSIQQNYFSEWSTVCLLKPIYQPTIQLGVFTPEGSNISDELILSLEEKLITGSFISENNERLESYQAKFWLKDDYDKFIAATSEAAKKDLTPVYDTELIYNTLYDSNGIHFQIYYSFMDGVRYTLEFIYTTENGFTETIPIQFVVLNTGGERLDAELTLTPDPEYGRIIINVKSEEERYLGNLTIRRTSSRSNFTFWEDVHHIPITSARDGIDETWYDYAVESGVWYKYGVQKRDKYKARGLVVPGKEPVMVMLNDIFLSTKEKALRIKFNPQINSITHVRTESSSQPLGSKYPFIKRNGATKYRQFNISGLISHFMDEENLFSSKEEIYGSMLDRHESYNYENKINDYTDFILEREFRQKVEEFLCDGKIKLFKSTPEGSMLVRLMNVSVTPEKALGRMLYSFNATAYEIADLTIKNINDYEIQDLGVLNTIPSGIYDKYMQIKIDNFGATDSKDVFELVKQHEKDNQDNPIYEVEATKIKRLKISFEGEPYEIYYQLPYQEGNKIIEGKFSITKPDKPSTQLLGYLFEIVNKNTNNIDTTLQQFYVPYRYTEDEKGNFKGYGEYTLSGDDPLLRTSGMRIVGLVPPQYNGIPVLLECLAEIEEFHVDTTNPDSVELFNKYGQVHNYFNPLENLISIIKEKSYYIAKNANGYTTDYQYIYFINSIRVESEPYAVFYKRSSDMDQYIKYVLGPGGYLTLEEDNFSIQELFFKGLYLPKTTKNKNIYDNVDLIDQPETNCIYTVKSLQGVYSPHNLNFTVLNSYTALVHELFQAKDEYKVVYINNSWWVYDPSDQVAVMPLYALVDYNYDLEKRTYSYTLAHQDIGG